MYMSILFFVVIMLISMVVMVMNFCFSKKMLNDRVKLSTFECGFDPFNSSRLPFSIHFFMISILFLVFDVEILFLIPLLNMFKFLNLMEWMYMSMMILLILFWGLEFEKYEGSLKWIL